MTEKVLYIIIMLMVLATYIILNYYKLKKNMIGLNNWKMLSCITDELLNIKMHKLCSRLICKMYNAWEAHQTTLFKNHKKAMMFIPDVVSSYIPVF